MFKLIISIYIFSILFFAGKAKATDFMSLQRVKNSAVMPLQIDAIELNESTGDIHLYGNNAGFCNSEVQAQVIANHAQNKLIISVVAIPRACIIEDGQDTYSVVVNIASVLAANPELDVESLQYKFMHSTVR